jgi:hypothetical protein
MFIFTTSLQILFVHFLALPSLLHPLIVLTCNSYTSPSHDLVPQKSTAAAINRVCLHCSAFILILKHAVRVRYQKLRHFLEPYHAPYTAKHRYWTGLLLIVHLLLSVLNFSLDQHVYLLSEILATGGLILLKGMIVERVYKNWPPT